MENVLTEVVFGPGYWTASYTGEPPKKRILPPWRHDPPKGSKAQWTIWTKGWRAAAAGKPCKPPYSARQETTQKRRYAYSHRYFWALGYKACEQVRAGTAELVGDPNWRTDPSLQQA